MLHHDSRLRHFPSLAGRAYLNTAAEGIPSIGIEKALRQYFFDHALGMDGRDLHFKELDSARTRVAQLMGLTQAETAICSCSSEAFNLAAMALRLRENDEVVVNELDFPAGFTPWVAGPGAAKVHVWKAREWGLRTEDLPAMLNKSTRVVVVSLVSFFNGFKLDLARTAQIVHKHSNAILAVDVTQAAGRIPMDLSGADLIISSTHKWLLATHGGGLVGVRSRRAAELTAPAGGWFNIENAFAPDRFERVVHKPGASSFAVGMPNFPAVYAINAALAYLESIGIPAIADHADPLMRRCIEGLRKLPVEVITPHVPEHLAGIIAFRHAKSDLLSSRLRAANIHIMHQAGRLRVSIHGYNTMDDIERFLQTLEVALREV